MGFHKRDKIGCYIVDTSQISEDKFETMVFRVVGGKIDYSDDLDGKHYDKEEDALKGHEEIVKKWS